MQGCEGFRFWIWKENSKLNCQDNGEKGAKDWSSCDDLIKSLNQEGNTKQADILSRMIKGGDKKRSKKAPLAA